MSEMKKIMILTADAGFGHRSAANAAAAALDEKYGKQCIVEIFNPLEDRRTPFFLRDSQSDYDRIVREIPELYRFGYEASDAIVPTTIFETALTVLLYEVLWDLIKKFQPDAILTTYPLYQAPIADIFTLHRFKIPTLTTVTDLVSVHRIWFNNRVDTCMVPTDMVKNLSIACGLSPEKVVITGIPVHPLIARENRNPKEIRASLGWYPDLPTFLAVGSKRAENLTEILNVFNHYGAPLQIVAVAGKDPDLFTQWNNIKWHVPTHLYEFSDQIPTFMHAANGLLCKAGGLILTEALACNLPIMLVNVLPGQETGNAEYVIQNGAADLATDPLTALKVLHHWMMNDGELLKQRTENARILGKPHSAYAVAELVWQAALQGPTQKTRSSNALRRPLIDLLSRNHVQWQDENKRRLRNKR